MGNFNTTKELQHKATPTPSLAKKNHSTAAKFGRGSTDKTIFTFPFNLNGIWSWWQFSFRFRTKLNSIWFKKSKRKLSPRSYPIQLERKWKYIFLADHGSRINIQHMKLIHKVVELSGIYYVVIKIFCSALQFKFWYIILFWYM